MFSYNDSGVPFIAHNVLEVYIKDWGGRREEEGNVSNAVRILDVYYATKTEVEPLLGISISWRTIHCGCTCCFVSPTSDLNSFQVGQKTLFSWLHCLFCYLFIKVKSFCICKSIALETFSTLGRHILYNICQHIDVQRPVPNFISHISFCQIPPFLKKELWITQEFLSFVQHQHTVRPLVEADSPVQALSSLFGCTGMHKLMNWFFACQVYSLSIHKEVVSSRGQNMKLLE